MAPNNLYIDEVHIVTDSGAAFSGIDNMLTSVTDEANNISKTTGYKWVVQITNGTGSSIDTTANPVKLQICTNYMHTVDGETVNRGEKEIDYIINDDADWASGASRYVGWTGIGAATVQYPENTLYMPNQTVDGQYDGNIIAAARVKLYHTVNGSYSFLDVGGDNSSISSTHFANSIINEVVFIDTTSGSNGTDGSWRRKPSVTSPATSYTSSDWRIGNIATTTHSNYLTGDAAAVGDPHIKTLHGEHYEFDYLGAFRMFEYLKNKNSIIINGLAETGPGRWKTKQYIRKIFIQNNDTNILLDMGFRGSPVKVLENNGIAYKEKTLSFDKKAKRYNFDNTMSTLDLDEPITEDVPGLIRNQLDIILEIDNNTDKTTTKKSELSFITLQNVNEYNLQPCRLEIKMSNLLIDAAKGCLIDRKYATVSKLNKITDVTPLEEPTLEDLKNIPELEIEPQKRNIMWK